jgi:hypothetical protein
MMPPLEVPHSHFAEAIMPAAVVFASAASALEFSGSDQDGGGHDRCRKVAGGRR